MTELEESEKVSLKLAEHLQKIYVSLIERYGEERINDIHQVILQSGVLCFAEQMNLLEGFSFKEMIAEKLKKDEVLKGEEIDDLFHKIKGIT